MKSFMLKPGGPYYTHSSNLSGKPAGKSGLICIEPGQVIGAPSIRFAGGGADRFEECHKKPDFVFDESIIKIVEPLSSNTDDALPAFKAKRGPFVFPLEDGTYHVYRDEKVRLTQKSVSLSEASELLDGLLEGGSEDDEDDEKPAVNPLSGMTPKQILKYAKENDITLTPAEKKLDRDSLVLIVSERIIEKEEDE